MNRPSNAQDHPAADVDDAQTGLPLLPSWRAVYIFVAVTFCLWIIGLVLLPVLCS